MTTDTRPTFTARGCRNRAELIARIAAWREAYVTGELKRAGSAMVLDNWEPDAITAALGDLRVELEAAAAMIEMSGRAAEGGLKPGARYLRGKPRRCRASGDG